MYKEKNVLLIAGGGTLGTYTAKELLRLGANVDIICPEEKHSDNEHLNFYQSYATDDVLKELFSKKHYDGIVNFIHYPNADEYKSVHHLLCANTDHLIFLSSYRVYADSEQPITEESPRLLDTMDDEEFLANETYALSKAKAENFIINESNTKNWTIIRPVISFSDKRLDLVMYSGLDVLEYASSGKEMLLPENVKNLTAGYDWAGNCGKLIANLIFNDQTFGECYTISSAQNTTWGEIANAYEEIIGLNVKWVNEETFLKDPMFELPYKKWGYFYDRIYDRKIDNTKVLQATGLTKEDFTSISCGIKEEVSKLMK